MDDYIHEKQRRLREKRIGYKKEFLREIIKEVRVRRDNVSLTYKLPMRLRIEGFLLSKPRTKELFTLYHLVEAGGIEPPSEGLQPNMTTCLAAVLISLFEPPTAGFRGASRFGSRPHPLRQRNQPIPLNDVLSNPVGEDR